MFRDYPNSTSNGYRQKEMIEIDHVFFNLVQTYRMYHLAPMSRHHTTLVQMRTTPAADLLHCKIALRVEQVSSEMIIE